MPRKELFISDLLPSVINIARQAGAVIMGHYKGGGDVDKKADASPVTEADRAADRFIVGELKTLAPSVIAVSEEGEKPDISNADYYWLIDPLDGTKSFIRGKGYFTVNIGLIQQFTSPSTGEVVTPQPGGRRRTGGGDNNTPPSLLLPRKGGGKPVMGVIYDPVNDVMYWGSEKQAFRDQGGLTEPIRTKGMHTEKPIALISHSHINQATEDYLKAHNVGERIPCASSIKFCWLAEGKADIYPRLGPTMEWDTAAGHAILIAAGGSVTMPDGMPFLYGKKGFLNGDFVASGRLT